MTILEQLSYLISKGQIFPANEKVSFLWFFSRTRNHGWISIDLDNEKYHILLTSDKDSHNRAFGSRAYAIDIDKKTGKLYKRSDWTGAWKSAITLHPVRKGDEDKAKKIEKHLHKIIDMAYSWVKSQE